MIKIPAMAPFSSFGRTLTMLARSVSLQTSSDSTRSAASGTFDDVAVAPTEAGRTYRPGGRRHLP